MLIQASTIINLPVAAMENQSKIGVVKDLVFNPDNGELLGLIVSKGGFFSKNKVLSSQDILDFDKNGIVTKTEENLLDFTEIVRIKKILEDNIRILHQKAITKSKKYLGKIYDVLIDSDVLMITKYYIHGWLEDKILPVDKVIKIDQKAVVFSDDVIEQTPVGEVEGAAA